MPIRLSDTGRNRNWILEQGPVNLLKLCIIFWICACDYSSEEESTVFPWFSKGSKTPKEVKSRSLRTLQLRKASMGSGSNSHSTTEDTEAQIHAAELSLESHSLVLCCCQQRFFKKERGRHALYLNGFLIPYGKTYFLEQCCLMEIW